MSVMYNIYTTCGIIIKTREISESDKILSVFTKDFGRLEIFVKGARNISSKLRHHLDLLDYSDISFIAGKEFWRLTGAEKISSWTEIIKDIEKIKLAAKTVCFMDKILQGEEKNEILWNILVSYLNFLNNSGFYLNDNTAVFKKTLENIITVKILYSLGYADESKKITKTIIENSLETAFIKSYEKYLTEIEKIAKKGITESGLFN